MKNPFKILIDKILKRNRKVFWSRFNMEPVSDIVILGYRLVKTCCACPEQYDVFTNRNRLVGYLRLRHGHFTAQYPDVEGSVVYSSSPKGDGMFDCDERTECLTEAIKAIKREEELNL